jgi:predicted HAD superfamily Cof-like phosphohydrolase
MNIFNNIVNWNEERGLIAKGFNHENEASFIVEELLESTGKYDSVSARDKSKIIAGDITKDIDTDAEGIVDAFGDIIVFAVGAIAKNGYDPEKVMTEICKEINSRTGVLVDGKFIKDKEAEFYKADFSAAKLQ